MKNSLKYILSAFVLAGSLVACSPDDFEGVNEAGIPQATSFGDNVKIVVDQELNQVSLTLDAPAVYPIWTITLPNGKEEKTTVNGYTKIYTNSGDYKVTVKVGNRNGISDGEYTTTFHINNSIVDFGKYTTMLSKANWHMANKEKGHLACGPSGTDGTEWWSGDPDCKLNEGVYDNELTFTSDFKYTFNPGEHGTIYVNKGVTIWPDYRNENEDYNVPVELQNSEYGLEVDGDDLYLTFPKGTYFPYIANDFIWNAPRYKVINLTTKKMTLLIDEPGVIAWQYILTTENTVEKAFTGFKYNGEFNLWKPIDDAKDYSTHYYYAPGWAQIADPEMTQEGSSYTWVLPAATTDQWMAQCPIKPTKLSLSAGAKYDFSCIITASEDLPGVTVKLTDVNTGDNYVFVERIPVKQYEDYVFYVSDVNNLTADADCELFFDFGGNPANTTVTVRDIVVKDHANDDGTVLPSDEPGGDDPIGPQVDWSGANLLSNMPVDITQWYAPGWNQIADAEYSVVNGVYTITYPEAASDQWMAQFTFNNTGIALDPDKTYDFRIKLTSSTDHPGVTIKLTQQDDDNTYITADRHALAAFEETWIELSNLQFVVNGDGKGVINNLKMPFDFGGIEAGTVITLSDMHLQEHKELAGGGSTNWKGENLLANMAPGLTQWYAPGWNQIADAEYTAENGVYDITYPSATTDQWMAQFTLNNTGITLDPSKTYDIRLKMISSTDHPGVTVKFTQQDDDNTFITADRHPLAAYEETWIELINLNFIVNGDGKGVIEDLKIVFDFGGNAENTNITISDIHLQEHIAGGNGGNAGGGNWVDVNSADNLMNSGILALASTWFADNSWNMLGNQPSVEFSGNNALVTVLEANGGSQWQGQVHLNTGVAIEEGKTYDFAIILTPTQDIAGATVKPHPEGDDDHFFSADRHDLEAYEDNRVTFEQFTADFSTSNLVITLDFPSCAADAQIEVREIIIQEHK